MFLNSAKQTIVIAGGGFGGLRTALDLNRAFRKDKTLASKFNLYLIDQNNHHLFTPSLYEIATTLYDDARALTLKNAIAPAFEKIISSSAPLKFYQARIGGIDVKHNQLTLNDRTSLHYNYLVLALGAQTNFHNIPGLEENSYLLKDINSAIRLRNAVAKAFEECLKKKKTLRIVFGGGGVGGVELAGEICGYLKKLNQKHHDSPQRELTIIEGRPEILPGFHPGVVKMARRRLAQLGVNMATGEFIGAVEKSKVITKSGKKFHFQLLVWSGGIKPNSLTLSLPFKRDGEGRTGVNNMFSPIFEDTAKECANDYSRGRIRVSRAPSASERYSCANVFIIGDNCCFIKDGQHLSQTAQTAIDQGQHVAKIILAKIKPANGSPASGGKETFPSYEPTPTRYILPVGGKYAVADFGFVQMGGFLVWLIKEFVFWRYLGWIMPWPKALIHWLRAVNLFVKND